MRAFRKAVIAGLATIAVFSSVSAFADFEGVAKKLGRGFSNAALGALEIPLKIYDVNEEEGGIAAYTFGTFKGIGYFIARECVGVTEIITFPMPLPGCPEDPREEGWGYGAIMRPEWIVDTDHNAYNIVYQKTAPLE